jgi:sarcosine oxidase subunit gamma
MSALTIEIVATHQRLGLKGPRAADWLNSQGFEPPAAPNTCRIGRAAATEDLLIARLGSSEFFLECGPRGAAIAPLELALQERPAGVYPVLREDWAFRAAGAAVHEMLAQVCNVNFAAVSLETNPVIMTLMVGVAVLVVPQGADGGRSYRIWCDPTFGPYLSETLGAVVHESGGIYRGVSA